MPLGEALKPHRLRGDRLIPASASTRPQRQDCNGLDGRLVTEDAMKGWVALCGLAGAVLVVPMSQTFAQSGVLSGPPQLRINKDPGGGSPVARQQGRAWIAVVGGFDGNGGKVSV